MTEPKQKQYKHWRIEVLDANNEPVDVDYVPTKKEAMKMVNRLLKDENLWQINLEHRRVRYSEFEDGTTNILDDECLKSELFIGKAEVAYRIERMKEKTNEIVYELFAKQ